MPKFKARYIQIGKLSVALASELISELKRRSFIFDVTELTIKVKIRDNFDLASLEELKNIYGYPHL